MLRKLELLALVVRGADLPVEAIRHLGHSLEGKAADHLPILKDERHLMAAHLEDAAAARVPVFSQTESGIEEAGVVNAELAHLRRNRDHLGRVIARDVKLLLGGEDVELIRIE